MLRNTSECCIALAPYRAFQLKLPGFQGWTMYAQDSPLSLYLPHAPKYKQTDPSSCLLYKRTTHHHKHTPAKHSQDQK